jgi:hypothetical protein
MDVQPFYTSFLLFTLTFLRVVDSPRAVHPKRAIDCGMPTLERRAI